MRITTISRLLFLAAFVLVFYTIGAALFEGQVNYPTWYFIGAAEFRSYHQEIGRRIIPVLVIPLMATFILTLVLLWFRPLPVSRKAVSLSVVLQLTVILSTVIVFVPIQAQLSQQGLSPELLDRLIATSWLRDIPGLVNGGLYVWMMYQMIVEHKRETLLSLA